MRSWSARAGGVLAGLAAGAVFYGCGQQSFGTCVDNGTCPGDGGDDAFVGASSGGDGSPGAGDGSEGGEGSPVLDGPNDGAPGDGSDGSMADGPGTDAPTDGAVETGDGFTCDVTKAPAEESCVIDNSLGVFVAPAANGGSDTIDGGASGTMDHPYATIGFALAHLNGTSRVYVCNAHYAEAVSISASASNVANLFGGLACPGSDAGAPWSYVAGGQAQVTAPAGAYALHVDGVATGLAVQDIAFTAPAATGVDSSGNGKSSIAALVNNSTVSFARVWFTAGAGAAGNPGQSGASASNYSGATAPGGHPGYSPADGGNGSGAGGMTTCSVYGSSAGGAGGVAGSGVLEGGAGASGTANGMVGAINAGGGGTSSCGTAAQPGADGAAAAGGSAATGYGTLGANGWAPTGGGAGQPGAPAQGGGGGGGQGSPAVGGDGGGAGGCGGSGGAGGKGGGASIALASINTTIVLTQCSLKTSTGGNGGTGGAGQDGQGGGTRGAGGCAGGYGGNGAGGSGGAGGTAGISVGIVYTGGSVTADSFTSSNFSIGAAGQPGAAGAAGQHGSGPLPTGNAGNPGAGGFVNASASGQTLAL